MNYTQNEKIEQVTDTTPVIGIDIGSQTHYARALTTEAVSSPERCSHSGMTLRDSTHLISGLKI